MTMTILDFEILFYYYGDRKGDHPYFDHTHGAAIARNGLVHEGLLEENPQSLVLERAWRLTEKGQALVQHAADTPMPVQRWVKPEQQCD